MGLNTMEQELMDLSNNLSRDGLIFFPDFCDIALKRFRDEDEEEFAKTMFKECFSSEYNSSKNIFLPSGVLRDGPTTHWFPRQEVQSAPEIPDQG